jgi:chemotaxis protein MotB
MVMRYGARRIPKKRGENGSYWISYSDLMSALLLVFILVLFYSLYQYWEMYETKQKELYDQYLALEYQKAAHLKSLDELDLKEDELQSKQDELTTAEQELIVAQILNEAQSKELEDIKAALDAQKIDLDAARAAYNQQESVLIDAQRQMDEQQTKIEQLIGVRAEIISQLMSELSANNITGAKVDDSGAIVFDSEMMFDVNRSVLKDQGKRFLNSFIPNYIKVLTNPENAHYVSQIIIEGHTDNDGAYMMNMGLSLDRANAVLDYIQSADFTGLSQREKDNLAKIVTVSGRSYSDPILNADGSINKDASRRVMIKFRLNDEQMVNDMAELLNAIH